MHGLCNIDGGGGCRLLIGQTSFLVSNRRFANVGTFVSSQVCVMDHQPTLKHRGQTCSTLWKSDSDLFCASVKWFWDQLELIACHILKPQMIHDTFGCVTVHWRRPAGAVCWTWKGVKIVSHPTADGALQVLQRAPGLVTPVSLAEEFIRSTHRKPEIRGLSKKLGWSWWAKRNQLETPRQMRHRPQRLKQAWLNLNGVIWDDGEKDGSLNERAG